MDDPIIEKVSDNEYKKIISIEEIVDVGYTNDELQNTRDNLQTFEADVIVRRKILTDRIDELQAEIQKAAAVGVNDTP